MKPARYRVIDMKISKVEPQTPGRPNTPPSSAAPSNQANITISIEQRDLLYDDALTHLSGMDGLWPAIDNEEFATADRLAHEYVDNLRLILAGLGWGDREEVAEIQLMLPPQELRRTLGRLRDRAERHLKHQEAELEVAREPFEHSRLVVETCDAVFAELDHADVSIRGRG